MFSSQRLPLRQRAVAMLLLPLAAQADTGAGVDSVLGNALNPAGLSAARAKDPDGLGEASHSRSPSGLLTTSPWAISTPSKSESGWLYNASVEAGGIKIGGDRHSAKFGEYKSLKSGAYLNNFSLIAEKPQDAQFVDIVGGALGQRDQYVGLTFGRYNAWQVKTFYKEFRHVFTANYRSLWSGIGTDTLTLDTLPAAPQAPANAASTDIAIGAAALAAPLSTLSIVRKKGGIRLDLTLPADWKVFAGFTSEKRQGARPFGMVSGGGGGTGGVEIAETLDYDTHDFIGGAQWSNARTSVNLQASASLFRNNVNTLTVANPLFLPAANGIARFPNSVFDLVPDNEYFNLKAEAAHSMPEFYRARITGVLSSSSSRQNDALIPSTPYAGAAVNGVAGGSWDSVASLSRANAGAKIDSTLADISLALSPAAGLDIKAKWRHYETHNNTDYLACNPLTGQWGRLINNGTAAVFAVPSVVAGDNPAGTTAAAYNAALCNLSAVKALNLVPSAGNVPLRNIPYDHQQTNASLAADYRLARGQSLNALVERESFDRSHRERDETWEDKIKLGYVNRALTGGTLRISLEQGRRRGSPYNADPYQDFYSISLGPLPKATGTALNNWLHMNDLLRRFDLADRDQTVLNLRFNHPLKDDLDLSLSAQSKELRYPDSAYGRNGHQRLTSLNAELNWQAAAETNVYGFASQQNGRMNQAAVQQNACTLGTTYFFYSDGSVATTGTPTAAQVAAGITVVANSGVVTSANFVSLCGKPSATSPLYPTSRTWAATQADSSTSLGIGITHDFGRARLDMNYSFTRSRTAISYSYNAAALGLVTSGAPTPAQLAALALIGNGFPDLIFKQNVLDASLLVPVNKAVAVRLLARVESGKFRDWHYDGVAANPTPSNNQQTYLDAGPQDYRTYMVGALLQLSW